MRQRLAIILTVVVVLVVLAALNAASYVRIEKTTDLEYAPDRSTYNAGATGTRALYDFLHESGRNVERWREAPDELLKKPGATVSTFVIVGETKVPLEEDDAENILLWVQRGGRLVLIGRQPSDLLLKNSNGWSISADPPLYPSPTIVANNPDALTEGISPARVDQPTALTSNIESVMPSRFAGVIDLSFTPPAPKTSAKNADPESSEHRSNDADDVEPPPPVRADPSELAAAIMPAKVSGPVVHISDSRGPILVDYGYGNGSITVLSDPFIIANNGISRADNFQLAINMLTAGGGSIAFDEYHQGHAVTRNRLIAYFAGTPVLALFGQFALVVIAVIWTRSRRFARPLPLPHVDRRSKLEYVASMAELQQCSRAYDLAIENVYTRTRRVLVRYAGLANRKASRGEIASRIAARSNVDRDHLESVMRDCEDAINGEPISARRSLDLVTQLREIERSLGLLFRSRDIRQAKERFQGLE